MRIALLLALALTACVGIPPGTPQPIVHDEFARRRPAMVALEVTGPEELRALLYRGLIDKDYSVLAPDEPPGRSGGIVRAKATGAEPTLKGTLTMLSPEGTRLFEAEARGRTLDDLAENLLTPLPRK